MTRKIYFCKVIIFVNFCVKLSEAVRNNPVTGLDGYDGDRSASNFQQELFGDGNFGIRAKVVKQYLLSEF